MPLATALQDFRDTVAFTNRVVASTHAIDASGQLVLPLDQRAFITQSAFLKSFIAWEAFLERSFLLFMTGKISTTGKRISSYVSPIDSDHANRIAIGTQKYVDWSNSEIVRKLANLYFSGGEPYESVLAGIHSELLDLKTIRNATAHISSTTGRALDALATRKLQRSCSGISAYELIVSVIPGSTLGQTVLATYQSHLDAAANAIASA